MFISSCVHISFGGISHNLNLVLFCIFHLLVSIEINAVNNSFNVNNYSTIILIILWLGHRM